MNGRPYRPQEDFLGGRFQGLRPWLRELPAPWAFGDGRGIAAADQPRRVRANKAARREVGVRSAQYRVLSAGAVMFTSGLDELDGTGCPKRPTSGTPVLIQGWKAGRHGLVEDSKTVAPGVCGDRVDLREW
ncbi:MAG: hypothetical protein JWP89_3163 [Schlesneria sp.]|nr:hypothetical protein [Schlesneria sp.]